MLLEIEIFLGPLQNIMLIRCKYSICFNHFNIISFQLRLWILPDVNLQRKKSQYFTRISVPSFPSRSLSQILVKVFIIFPWRTVFYFHTVGYFFFSLLQGPKTPVQDNENKNIGKRIISSFNDLGTARETMNADTVSIFHKRRQLQAETQMEGICNSHQSEV